MGELVGSIVRFAVTGGDFSVAIWLGMTFMLLLLGCTLAAVAPRLLDPVAVEVALRPERVLMWIPISVLGLAVVLTLFAASIIGIPVAALLGVAAPFVGIIGYLAAALILGDRIGHAYGRELAPWIAVAVGVVAFRLVRALPFVGAPLHSVIGLFGFAAVSAVAWDLARSWHARRMPDVEQFQGEQLIEWNPQDAPEPPPPPPAWRQ